MWGGANRKSRPCRRGSDKSDVWHTCRYIPLECYAIERSPSKCLAFEFRPFTISISSSWFTHRLKFVRHLNNPLFANSNLQETFRIAWHFNPTFWMPILTNHAWCLPSSKTRVCFCYTSQSIFSGKSKKKNSRYRQKLFRSFTRKIRKKREAKTNKLLDNNGTNSSISYVAFPICMSLYPFVIDIANSFLLFAIYTTSYKGNDAKDAQENRIKCTYIISAYVIKKQTQ